MKAHTVTIDDVKVRLSQDATGHFFPTEVQIKGCSPLKVEFVPGDASKNERPALRVVGYERFNIPAWTCSYVESHKRWVVVNLTRTTLSERVLLRPIAVWDYASKRSAMRRVAKLVLKHLQDFAGLGSRR